MVSPFTHLLEPELVPLGIYEAPVYNVAQPHALTDSLGE
jgi:hypothetical protein